MYSFWCESSCAVLKNFSRINTHIWTLTDMKLAYTVYILMHMTKSWQDLVRLLIITLHDRWILLVYNVSSLYLCSATEIGKKIRWHFISYHHTCISSLRHALQVEFLQVCINTVWFLLNNVTFSKQYCQWNYRNTRKHIYI